ncbi:MAG: Hsp20/alpha crystallin family protein [Myxococcales bacterium]|nr:Hsp20/alpha crystallin family protein [Myxococcales bacterium]
MTQAITQRSDQSSNKTRESIVEHSTAPHSWASAAIDILEGDDSFLVIADVPGASKEHIDLTYQNDELRIVAQRDDKNDEVWPNEYKRTIQLPRDIDIDRTTAELRNGVLSIELPKIEAVKPRQIKVTTS